jgi:hypothetical protein
MGINVEHYNQNRGRFSPLIQTDNGMVSGFWMVGNDYRNPSGYYGAYPPGYLKRISLLFPDPDVVLHLFSGKVEKGSWGTWPVKEVTCDCNASLFPDVCVNARELHREFEPKTFDLIVGDPPYDENHVQYGTVKVNKSKVIKECSELLCIGGHLVWLDTIQPIWSKADGWKLVGVIGLLQSTNHKVRVISIFERVR